MWKPIIFDVECIVCNKSLQKIGHDPQTCVRMGKIINVGNRRSRTPNWSFDEKQCLLELIKARKEAVIAKNNNGPNYSEEKDIAWTEILQELGKRFGPKFGVGSIKKVKTQWQNMKRIAREEIAVNGPILYKLSRQTVEVCDILGMMKDGVLKYEGQGFNDSTMTTNFVEIKTERIDEEADQPSCSGARDTVMVADDPSNNVNDNVNSKNLESSASSASEQCNELDMMESAVDQRRSGFTKNSSVMTDRTFTVDSDMKINPFRKEMEEYFKFISSEKMMKMESLKEERQVIRAMRETAELNKIIAEQKLKHVLWVKKQEML